MRAKVTVEFEVEYPKDLEPGDIVVSEFEMWIEAGMPDNGIISYGITKVEAL